MKRAYLFGAAALLILLIVVAYVSFSREKKEEGGACVRPTPQLVGPTADPVVRALAGTFSEEGDEEEISLKINRSKQKGGSSLDTSGLTRQGEVSWTDEELLDFRRSDYPEADEKHGGALVVAPVNEEEMLRDLYSSMGAAYTPKTHIVGGPSPVPSLLQSAICPITYSPLTPFRPGSEPVSIFEETERTFLDASMSDADAEESMNRSVASSNNKRLQHHEYLLRQQRDYVVTLPMDDPLRKAFMREEQRALSSGDLQRLISVETGKPIDISFLYPLPRLRGEDRSPTPDSSGEFGAFAEGRYYPPLDR